jgi:Ser/Thr protein kinase RdoA (MazF antagonist)
LETAAAQVAAARVFVASGIPLAAPIAGPVEAGDRLVVMCEWLDGEIATRPTPERAFAIGEMLARMHRLPIPIDDRLPVHDLFTTAAKSLAMLPEAAQASEIVDRARGDDPRVVVHGDVNFPNVLWAGDRVTGLVDLDQIGLSRPIEELAWAVKWWSRTGGIGDHDPDPALARAVIEGYGGVEDRDALAAMVWIAGCLNANSVLRADAAGERRTRADRLARVVAQ